MLSAGNLAIVMVFSSLGKFWALMLFQELLRITFHPLKLTVYQALLGYPWTCWSAPQKTRLVVLRGLGQLTAAFPQVCLGHGDHPGAELPKDQNLTLCIRDSKLLYHSLCLLLLKAFIRLSVAIPECSTHLTVPFLRLISLFIILE